jgi:hypothetical protein
MTDKRKTPVRIKNKVRKILEQARDHRNEMAK